MTSKAEKTREEQWADAQDYPDMPDGNLPEKLLFDMWRDHKVPPEEVSDATSGRGAGLPERYREWLKDHPFES